MNVLPQEKSCVVCSHNFNNVSNPNTFIWKPVIYKDTLKC